MFKKMFFGLMAIILVVSISTPVLASPNFVTSDESGLVTITSPIGDDTYIAGGDIVIDSNIAGDLFVAGGNIDINADVVGDLFVVGGQISVRGSVGDDIRIGGGQITIHGNVGDDVIVGGGSVTLADTSTVRGDLLIGSGEFNLYGRVLGNVKAGFGEGRIKGTISGNANLRYGDGKLTFADGANIGGKLDYWAVNENVVFADIANEIEFHKWINGSASTIAPAVTMFAAPLAMMAGALWTLLGILVLGGLLILILPKYLPRIVTTIKKNYWNGLWQGFVFIIVVPLIALLIAFTGFGIPLSLLIMLSYFSVMILASVPISMAIGSYIVKYQEKDKSKQFGALVLGAGIYLILGMLPIVGWTIKLLLFVIGIGIILMDARTQVKKGNY